MPPNTIPKAVYDAIHLLHDLYDIRCPIYITENGTYATGEEPVGEDGIICDSDRIRYIGGFLEWLEKAIDEGFDVRGYFLWSRWTILSGLPPTTTSSALPKLLSIRPTWI